MFRSKAFLLVIAFLVVASIVTAGSTVPNPTTAVSLPRLLNTFLAPFAALAQQETPGTTTQVSAPAAAPATTINIPAGADAQDQLLEAIFQKVDPSVVQIINLSPMTSGRGRSQSSGPDVPQSEGSGFIWDKQGHIITNDHVVEGADQLQVVFADGTQVDAKLVGTDPSSDLAVIQVDPTAADLLPIEQGNMATVKVGDRAIAIGNPFGFQNSMTHGIVSALGRSIPSQTNYDIPEAIQTDAAINPGNSGGPLLNSQGQVIGVNDQIQSDSGSNSGVGFAIPISIVQRVVPSIIQTGSYQHPYLGISGDTFNRSWAQALGFPATAKGAYVMEVAQGGPAAEAGIVGGSKDTTVVIGADQTGLTYLQSGGDLVTAIDNRPVTSMDDLLIYLAENATPNQTVQLTVLRAGGAQQTVAVKLGVQPAQQSTDVSNLTNS